MNNLVFAARKALSNYVNFSGRASRAEFWWWILALLIANVVTGLIDGAIVAPLLGFETFGEDAGQPLSFLLALALLLPCIAAGVRRLHDTDRSGWWLLLGLIPLIGTLILLYFYILQGDEEANRFGAPEPFDPV